MSQGSSQPTPFDSPAELDARLVAATRDVILAGQECLAPGPVLEQTLPKLAKQIKTDSGTPGLFDLWGQSVNFDEHAELTIVEPAVLLALRELTGVPLGARIVHAGLQHTYGYLLSLVETPYGTKRERWVNSTIEDGFGIEEPTLRPYPNKGTLLLNVTIFLGRIAFRHTRRESALLDELKAPPTLRRYPFSSMKIQRITETFTGPNFDGALREVRLFTDLVTFPKVASKDAVALLIYSAYESDTDRTSLITAFPVGQDAQGELTAPGLFGINQEIRTRYNCFLPGVTGTMHNGTRTLSAE